MQFESEAQAAMDTAVARGAVYADVRFGIVRDEHLEVRNGVVNSFSDSESRGFSVRALVDGAWGFASSANLSKPEVDRIAALAVEVARASAKVKAEGIELLPAGKQIATFKTPFEIDPNDVSVNDRLTFLLDVEAEVRAAKGVTVGRAWMDAWRTTKEFASTEGSRISQELLQCGSACEALAVGEGDVQDRIFPGTCGLYQTGGYEIVKKADLPANARRTGQEAVALLTAEQCPSGTMDVILSGDQVSLQIHESIGHALELDRVLGWEANFSGTSFATLDKLGTFKYGSPIVNVVCDMTCPLAFATHGFDDEGTPAASVYLIKDGILVGYMAGRDTAMAAKNVDSVRLRALRVLGTAADDPHRKREPAARHNARAGAFRRREKRRLYGKQPFVVHRRQAAELPVRMPDRLRDQERQEGQAAQEPDLRGHDAEILGLLRRDRGRERVDRVGHAELRQRANPCRPHVRAKVRRRRASATSTSVWWVMIADLAAERAEAEKVLDIALEESKADATEVLLTSQNLALSRITHNVIHENLIERDRSLNVRVVVDKRVGVASSNDLDRAGIRTAVARAIEIARVSPADEEFPGLPSAGTATNAMEWAYDAPTAALTPDQRAAAVADIVRVMVGHRLTAAGYVSTSSGSVAIANTNGIKQFFRSTDSAINIKAMGDDSSGYAEGYSRRFADLDAARLGETAAKRAVSGRNPGSVEPGEYTVILEPPAAANISAISRGPASAPCLSRRARRS